MTDTASFTRTAAAMVAENDSRIPAQRRPSQEPSPLAAAWEAGWRAGVQDATSLCAVKSPNPHAA